MGKQNKNQSLEICKLIASFFVVFLHVPFPGTFGGAVSCLSRFAVPLFFAISGWFSYQTGPEKLAKRMGRILLLELAGIFVHFLWGVALTMYQNRSFGEFLGELVPTASEIARWIVLNIDPYAGHLWYLSAAALCYGVLWMYVRFLGREPIGYQPLYVLGVLLGAMHFAMAEFGGSVGLGVPFQLYRNGLFFGLPMFLMGLFLREHHLRLLENFSLTARKLVLLLGAGILLSLVEWKGLGGYELHFGTLVMVVSLLLLTALCPEVSGRFPRMGKLVPRFGTLSTAIYLVHLVIYDVYLGFFRWRLEAVLGSGEPWAAPVLVAAGSLTAAAVWERLWHRVRRIHKKKEG